MKIIVEDKDVKLDDLSDLLGSINDSSSDSGIVKKSGRGPAVGDGRGKEIPELTRELMALDYAANQINGITQTEVGKIHGSQQQRVSQLAGNNINGNASPDLKAKVDQVRNRIENTAISKLMSTLDLFNPEALTDQNEVINAASKMSQIVERVSGKRKDETQQVHLHLYAPRVKKEMEYEVIDVG